MSQNRDLASYLTPSEHQDQVTVYEWLAAMGISDCFAIPNAGKRSKAAGAWMVAEGLRKGVPDNFLAMPRGEYHGLFWEMKTPTGEISRAQADWIKRLRTQGYAAIVPRSVESAISLLSEYLALKAPSHGK